MSFDDHFLSKFRFWLVLLAAALVLPWLPLGTLGLSLLRIATLVLLYMVLAQGLNVVVGFAGRLDLGYVVFFAVGAYTAGLLEFYWHWNPWLVLGLALVQGAFWGWLRGVLLQRLSGYAFALASLAFAELFVLLVRNEAWLTGGEMGMAGLARPGLAGNFLEPAQLSYYLMLFLLLLVLGVVARARSSRFGPAWLALYDDSVAAACAGIEVSRSRLFAEVLSAVIGALAGAFYAGWLGFIHPDMFGFRESLVILCLVALGGPGRIAGVLLGSLLLVSLDEALQLFLPAGLGPVRYLVFGLLVIAALHWRYRDRLFRAGTQGGAAGG
jgi:branched-chain amino acid transport system permease protein